MKSYYYNLDQKPVGNELTFGAENFLTIRILGDGNCFFRSISEISNLDGGIKTITHLQLREEVQKELRSDELLKDKVCEELNDKFDQEVEDSDIEEYIDNIGYNAEYAGSPECYAASKILKAKVLIYRPDQPLEHAITSYDYRELIIQDTTPIIPALRLIYQPYNELPGNSPNHYNILVDPALKTIFEEGDYSAKQAITSSRVIDKISQKGRRDAAFLSDAERLIEVYTLIEQLELIDGGDENNLDEIAVKMKQVGLSLKNIYWEQDDKDNFRNKYTLQLALDLFDKLEFIEEEKNKIKLLVKNYFNSDIKKIFSDIKQNIEFVLYKEKDRLINYLNNQPEKQSLIDILNAFKAYDRFTIDNFNGSTLAIWIALYYIPKAIVRISQELESWVDLDLNTILDRYCFSRKITIIGETSKGIKSLLSFDKESQGYQLFNAFGKLRDAIKTNHFSFTVSQPNSDTADELRKLRDELPNIQKQINKLKILYMLGAVSSIIKVDYDSIKAPKPIKDMEQSTQVLSNSIKIIEEHSKAKKSSTSNNGGKFKEAKALIDTIINLQNKPEMPRESDADLLSEYQTAYHQLCVDDRAKIPQDTDIQVIKRAKIKNNKKEPSEGLAKTLKIIKKIKAPIALTKQEQIKEKLDEYRAFYEGIQNDKSVFLVLPEPDEESIKFYRTTIMNIELEKFHSCSQEYYKETPRLESFLSQYSQATDSIHKTKLEMAIAHSLGLIGEDIRYILEIDENSDFLSAFLTPQILQEINHARHIRNKQVFHGIFDYNFDDVLNAANDEAVGWAQDISAVYVIENFGRVIELHKSYFSSSIIAIADADKEIMISIYYKLMDAFSRIHQHEKAKNYANKLLNLIEDDSNFIVQKIMAYITKASTLHFTNRNQGAEDVLKEALSFAEAHNTYQGIDKYKSIIYTNLATIMSYKGSIETAIKYYDKSAAISLDILRIYPLAQKATLIYQNDRSKTLEAIQIIKKLQNEQISNGISRNNVFEIFQLQRLIGVIYADYGSKDTSFLWHQKSKELFYKYIGFFKAQLGQRHKMIESIIHLDSASLLYDSGNYREAIIKYEMAYPIFLESNSNEDIARINLYVGHCYKYLSQSCDISEKYKLSKLAIRNFEQSIVILNNQEDSKTLELAHAYAGLSEAKLRIRKKDESKELTRKASEIFKSYGKEGKSYNNIHKYNIKIILQSQNYREISKTMSSSNSRFENLLQATVDSRKSLFKKVDKESRIEEIKSVLTTNPENNMAKYNLMMELMKLYCQLKKSNKAIAQLKQINLLLKTNPEFGEKDFVQRANAIFQLIGISSIKMILKEDIYNYNNMQDNLHLRNVEKQVLQQANALETLNILLKKIASIYIDKSTNNGKIFSLNDKKEEVFQKPSICTITLFSENSHTLDHRYNILTLIKMLSNNKISFDSIFCLERKQLGSNLGIKDVVMLAKMLSFENADKFLLFEYLQKLPIYYDALLYNMAKSKDIQVIGIEGKGLAYSKESPYYHQAREEYMAERLIAISKLGKNAIFLVGSAHINNLIKLLGEQNFRVDNSEVSLRQNLITLKFNQAIFTKKLLLPQVSTELLRVTNYEHRTETDQQLKVKSSELQVGQSYAYLAYIRKFFEQVDLNWQLQKLFHCNDIWQYETIKEKYSISASFDVFRDSNSNFRKSVLLKLHPDKNPGKQGCNEDFIFVTNLREKLSKPFDIQKYVNNKVQAIQPIIHKANIGFKTFDTAIETARLMYIPTIDNAKKVLIDTTYLYSMSSGVNGISVIINGVDVAYKTYQGEYNQALNKLATTGGYMALPSILAYTGILPYVGFAYGALITAYTGYNAISNVYTLYKEYGTVEWQLKSAMAHKDLFEILAKSPMQQMHDFVTDSKQYELKINTINLEIEKTQIKQQLEAKGEFGNKLYAYIYAPMLEEKYSLLIKVTEALKAKHIALTVDKQYYQHCIENKSFNNIEIDKKPDQTQEVYYYCYNEEQQILDQILIGENGKYVEIIERL